MRLKIRSSAGTQVLDLPKDAAISTLIAEIRKETFITGELDIKYGYPPKSLQLDDYPPSTALTKLPVKLQGEQLIVSSSGSTVDLRGTSMGTTRSNSTRPAAAAADGPAERAKTGISPPKDPSSLSSSSTPAPFSFSTGSSVKTGKLLPLTRTAPRFNNGDPPDVRLSSGRGTAVLRVMEDDNSCLFRALSYIMTRSMMSGGELRQLVAGTIQDKPQTYTEAVLEQKPDGYCEWIKMESSWGGGIELGILADFFEVEICTIDVATGNIIRFNESRDRRVIVVYSGIHYDALALSPSGSLIHDSKNDELVFDKNDKEILTAAQELCNKLRMEHYFTDTKNFAIKCNICKKELKGEKEAIDHAQSTGHHSFGEA